MRRVDQSVPVLTASPGGGDAVLLAALALLALVLASASLLALVRVREDVVR